jgi:Zn-dependent protease
VTDDRWLPPGGSTYDLPARAQAPEPEREPEPEPEREPEQRRRGLLGRLLGPLVALGALATKLKGFLLVLTKAKFLVTSGSMLVSIAAYALIWGWQFGVGFVLLLLVHEYGHVIQLRREGLEASAPVFIPFFGAAIWSKSLGEDAAAEARVGIAGPILGSIGALACVGIYALTGNHLFQALAFTGFFLNLFNLLPVGFLDGGRVAAALSPWVWLLGVFGMVVLVLTLPNPIIVLIAILSIYETYKRFRAFRAGGEDIRKYYGIRKRDRIVIGASYLALIILLVVAMDLTHLQRSLPQ